MKLIIAGSRCFQDHLMVCEAIGLTMCKAGWKPGDVEVVFSGVAQGVDTSGELWAAGYDIPVRRFHANWKMGKHAGLVRNEAMGREGTHLLAIWDGISSGTKHMIKFMRKQGKPVEIWTPPQMKLDLDHLKPIKYDLFS